MAGSTEMPANVLVVGAGAVGAFYASRLAQAASTSVSVICRSNYAAVKANGFFVRSPLFGSYRFTPANTFSSPQEARSVSQSRPWDYILVCTKALPDISDDSAVLEGLVGRQSAIVLLQNGVGIETPYARRFPDATILSAVTVASCAQPEPGTVRHNGWTKISIGPYLPETEQTESSTRSVKKPADQNDELVKLLRQGGIEDAESFDHSGMQLVRWHKVAINAAMNPSSVLSGGSNNEAMTADPEVYAHLKGIMDEVLTAAPKILGKAIPDGLPTPDQVLMSLLKSRSGSRPSMLLDWEQAKPLEVEVILGNPLRIAREKGIEMPRLQSLYALLRMAQENRDAQKQSKI